jgi:hypothetical protein
MQQPLSYDRLVEKWAPVLNEESAGVIKDYHRKAVTAAILENQEVAMREEAAQYSGFLTETRPATNNDSSANWNPVLISLVRRAMPNLMAYDICGVQPMTGPTGLIFAMKSRYTQGTTGATEALYNEADTRFSGTQVDPAQPSDGAGLSASSMDSDSTADDARVTALAAKGLTTDSAEALGDSASNAIANMGFTIEKSTVTARSRALKAEYTMELAQDLKAIHGLDAETELANILSTEILVSLH